MNIVSTYRKELKDKILKVAMNEFFAHGIKNVKIDDIAKKLSISKRTLYELFVDKETLLLACMEQQELDFENHMMNFSEEHNNDAIDIILEFHNMQMEDKCKVSPDFFSDFTKYKKVSEFLAKKRDERNSHAVEFFEKGIDQGYFRKDINYSLALKICQANIQNIMEKQLYKDYDMSEIFKSFIFVFVRGLCTTKGLKVLDKELLVP